MGRERCIFIVNTVQLVYIAFEMTLMQGKVVALIHGALGIGLATVKLLSSRGAILSLADI